jgi:hypothetical protein
VHFYSKFWRKSRSNSSSRNEILTERDVARSARPRRPSIAILSTACQFSPHSRAPGLQLEADAAYIFKVTGRSPHARTRSTGRSGGIVRHRVPLTPPPVNDPSAPSYDLVTSPTPCLDPVEAQTTPCCAAVPRASPEHVPPRLPPPGAAGRARRRHPHPVFGFKPTCGEFMVTSLPFPRPPAPPARRILAGTAAPQSKGHIAGLLFFPGCFVQARVLSVKDRKVPGTLA